VQYTEIVKLYRLNHVQSVMRTCSTLTNNANLYLQMYACRAYAWTHGIQTSSSAIAKRPRWRVG